MCVCVCAANLVLCMLATGHRGATQFALYRSVAAVRALLVNSAHHVLCPLLVPDLHRERTRLGHSISGKRGHRYGSTSQISVRFCIW